jgi:hypothetical protein
MHTFSCILIFAVPTILLVMNTMWFAKILRGLKKTLAKRQWREKWQHKLTTSTVIPSYSHFTATCSSQVKPPVQLVAHAIVHDSEIGSTQPEIFPGCSALYICMSGYGRGWFFCGSDASTSLTINNLGSSLHIDLGRLNFRASAYRFNMQFLSFWLENCSRCILNQYK